MIKSDEKSESKVKDNSSVCRICFSNDQPEDFIKPCKCAGTMENVHEVCLKIWINSSNSTYSGSKCELCKSEFVIEESSKRKFVCIKKTNNGCSFYGIIFGLYLIVILLVTALVFLSEKMSDPYYKDELYIIILIGFCAILSVILCIINCILLVGNIPFKIEKNWRVKSMQKPHEIKPLGNTGSIDNMILQTESDENSNTPKLIKSISCPQAYSLITSL